MFSIGSDLDADPAERCVDFPYIEYKEYKKSIKKKINFYYTSQFIMENFDC